MQPPSRKLYAHMALILIPIICSSTSDPKADQTYSASCKASGDAITFTSSGESVLEQRLVRFVPSAPYIPYKGQLGTCFIKQDPAGYKWVKCWKKGTKYATGNWDDPLFIIPTTAIANSVQYRGWVGACKVKL